MESEERQSKARPGFRVAAGIISVLTFTIGLPVSVFVSVRSDSSMWFVALASLVSAIGFATVALTGRWFCFRKVYHESNNSGNPGTPYEVIIGNAVSPKQDLFLLKSAVRNFF